MSDEIKQGEGMIAYRKVLWKAYYLTKEIEELSEYKDEVYRESIAPIESKIEKKEEQLDNLKQYIKQTVLSDPAVSNTKTGKKISLPDVGTFSVKPDTEEPVVEDKEKAMDFFGEDFYEMVRKLDGRKVNKEIKENIEFRDGKFVYTKTGEIVPEGVLTTKTKEHIRLSFTKK